MADEKTSQRAASAAARTLRDRNASDDAKTAAASALNQAEDRETAGASNPSSLNAGQVESGSQGQAAGGSTQETAASSSSTAAPVTVVPEVKPKLFVKFHLDQKSPTLDISNGGYDRKFNAADQPFEVAGVTHTEIGLDGKPVVDKEDNEVQVIVMTADEELRLLLGTGLFVEATAEN